MSPAEIHYRGFSGFPEAMWTVLEAVTIRRWLVQGEERGKWRSPVEEANGDFRVG